MPSRERPPASTLLMTPGPTEIDPRVVAALGIPPVHHLSAEFIDLVDDTCRLLAQMFGGRDGKVVVLPSTGRGAVESVLTSIDLRGGHIVIVNDGSFGAMMARIARSLGLQVIEVINERPGEPIPIDRVANVVDSYDARLIGVVHCESSTGMINDLDSYSDLARSRGAHLLVDAVSSLGGVSPPLATADIDFCVSATQKAVGGVTGLSMVALNSRAIAAVEERREAPRGYYLDLARWWEQWLPKQDGGHLRSGHRRLPWSMPTHLTSALHRACSLAVDEETLAVRATRHHVASVALGEAASALGYRPLVGSATHRSPTLTALRPPLGVRAGDVIASLRSEHGILISGGMDGLDGQILRIGHMAETARPDPLLRTVEALRIATAPHVAVPDSSQVRKILIKAWDAGS